MLKGLPRPVEVVFQREGIRTLNEDSEVMLTVYSSLAQEESRSLSESVAWGRRRLAERGKITEKYPRYGYEYAENGDMVINTEQAKIVQRMYRELLDGKSTNRMAKELSEEGIETPRGNKRWDNRTVDCIITNPIYTGDYTYQRFIRKEGVARRTVANQGELPQYVIEDHHPAIVSRVKWEKAQQIMENRGGNKGRKLKPHDRQEFFDMFHCPECGGPVTHVTSSRNGAHYWRCKAAATRRTETTCTVRGFREESIEHTFMTMLQEMRLDEGFESKVQQSMEKLKPSAEELKSIESIKEEMQNLYHDLYDTVEEGDKHGGDPNQIKQITDQIVACQNQIYEFEEREQQSIELQKDLDWFFGELGELQQFDPEKQRIEFRPDIFSQIVEKGVIFPDGRITYDFKFGIQWTVTGVEKMAWKLKKKGKPRKRKKK